MNERLIKFRLRTHCFPDLWKTFFPHGQTQLNSTTWRGKEPRSCGVVGLHGEGSDVLITVAYRPKGYVYFVGDTKYDGWTAMVLDRAKDGTLLDGSGKPLPPGAPPVYLPFELYKDTDFNSLDFGEFLEEVEGAGVERHTHEEVMRRFDEQLEQGEQINSSINSEFMAPKRHRPYIKIILTSMQSGELPGQFGEKITNINVNSPYLRQEVQEQIERLMTEFLEGRISLSTMSSSKMVFVDLSDSLVDCTPNEKGQESRFHVLNEYITGGYLEELAKRLMANYRVAVSVVDGRRCGLLVTTEPPDRRHY